MNQSPIIHCLYAPNRLLQLQREVQWNLTKKKNWSGTKKKSVLRATTSEIYIHNLNHFKETHWIVHFDVVLLILCDWRFLFDALIPRYFMQCYFGDLVTISTCTCMRSLTWYKDTKTKMLQLSSPFFYSCLFAQKKYKTVVTNSLLFPFLIMYLFQTVSHKPSLITQPMTLQHHRVMCNFTGWGRWRGSQLTSSGNRCSRCIMVRRCRFLGSIP